MTTMKCRSCQTPMVVDRCESSEHATTCWHQCPLCKQVRLTSERAPASARHASSVARQAEDSTTFPAEPESQVESGYLFT